MELQFEHMITMVAVVGSALTVYFNLKKFGENIKKEAEWRTTVNNDMKNLLEKVTELLRAHGDTAAIVRELIESRIRFESEINNLNANLTTAYKRIDELREDIATTRKNVHTLRGELLPHLIKQEQV